MDYDMVWFSLYIYEKYDFDPERSVVTVHDPLELFGQVKDWKDREIDPKHISTLKRLKYINTTSKEVREILASVGIDVPILPTASLLTPAINVRDVLDSQETGVMSVTNVYPRKNIPLLLEVLDCIKKEVSGIRITTKIGDDVLSETEYVQLFDDHDIYVCTSFQEGGPIPAFDAMCRGLVVVTTPVGQIQEIITHGVNGFICNSREEFLTALRILLDDKDRLNQMKKNSLETFKTRRSKVEIRKRIVGYLERIKQ